MSSDIVERLRKLIDFGPDEQDILDALEAKDVEIERLRKITNGDCPFCEENERLRKALATYRHAMQSAYEPGCDCATCAIVRGEIYDNNNKEPLG